MELFEQQVSFSVGDQQRSFWSLVRFFQRNSPKMVSDLQACQHLQFFGLGPEPHPTQAVFQHRLTNVHLQSVAPSRSNSRMRQQVDASEEQSAPAQNGAPDDPETPHENALSLVPTAVDDVQDKAGMSRTIPRNVQKPLSAN